MSDEADAIWAGLVSGEGPVPSDPRVLGALRQRVAGAQRDGDRAARVEALTVASALAEQGGLHWVGRFADDPDAALRSDALAVGVAHGDEGMQVVRAFVRDPDPEVCLRVLALLTERADRSATPRVRLLLSAPDERVRASAAHLLGFIAGPVVRPQLSALVDGDASDQVRAAAATAIARIHGQRSKEEPQPWTPVDLSAVSDEPPAAMAEVPLDPPPLAMTPEPAPPAEVPLPASPPSVATPRPAPITVGTPLPASLPEDGVTLLRWLGAAREADREAVIQAAAALAPGVLGRAIAAYREGGDPLHGVGASRCARALSLKSAVTDLKRWLADPDPAVRVAALRALGELGGPAVLPTMSAVLRDRDSAVRVVAVGVIADAARRLEVPHMARTWLTPVQHGPDKEAAAAARDALAALKAQS